MTSTTSSKGFKQGLSMLRWNVKHSLPVIIIYLSLIVFFGVIYYTGGLAAATFTNGLETNYNPWIDASIAMASMTTFLSFVFMIVLSIKEFSYLHNKRKTDMFGAMPISRRTLFVSKSLTVFLISAVPMTVVMLILMLVSANMSSTGIFGTLSKDLNVGDMLLRTLLNLSANIAFFGFLSVCCGKTSEKIFSYIIINGAYPIGMLLLQLLPASFLYGYRMNISEYLTFAFCPAFAGFAIGKLYWLMFTALFYTLALFLVKKRKAESAQSHSAYKAPQIIVKLLISLSVGLALGYFFVVVFADSGVEVLRFWLGMIIGSFLSFMVAQIIFAGGFKKFGKSLISYGIMIAAFGVVFAVVACGLFGYNSYIPKAEDVKSVTLTEGKSVKVDGVNILNNDITDKQSIEDITEMHTDFLNMLKSSKHSMRDNAISAISSIFDSTIIDAYSYGYYFDMMDYLDYGNLTGCNITYTLNNGTKVERSFNYLSDFDYKKLSENTLKTYYKATSPLFICDEKYAVEASVYDWNEDYDDEDYGNDTFEGKKLQELINAIKADFEEYGASGKYSETEIDITYGMKTDEELFDNMDAYESIMKSTAQVNIYIPTTYTRTLALISKNAAAA